MAQNRHNGLPAYQQIQRAIRQRIEAKQLRTGDAVSSERELARIHGVSLMTARHALAGLEREGVVERRPGAGTFVAPPRIHFNKLMSYTEQMASDLFDQDEAGDLCDRVLPFGATLAVHPALAVGFPMRRGIPWCAVL
jgi:DNA-binding GntR family transcriptional regulator